MAQNHPDDAAYWEDQRRQYIAKTDLLQQSGWLWVPPELFYRRLFRGLEEERGDGRGTGIAIEVTANRYVGKDGRERPVAHRVQFGQDLSPLYDLMSRSLRDNSFALCSPMSYFGGRRTAVNAHCLYALVVDLDGVGPAELGRLLVHARHESGYVPPPSYLVVSGTGLHVYYVLDEPVAMYPRRIPGLQALKSLLVERVWCSDTSTIDVPQFQGIYQGFRVVGSATRLDGALGSRKDQSYEAVAFQASDVTELPRLWSIVDLVEACSPGLRRGDFRRQQLGDLVADTTSRVPLADARERWPEWYQARIVDGEPASDGWTAHRGLYDWYLDKAWKGALIGHRYWSIAALSAYATKCGIGYDELEADALALQERLAGQDAPGNAFTTQDVYDALDAYYGTRDARRLTRAYIERITGIDMPPKHERKGRTRAQSIAIAQATRDILYPEGEWRNEDGAPTKDMLVWAYAYEHPGASHAAIARGAGVSRPTVIKWLSVPDWQDQYRARAGL